jgi:DNA-binding MarR family transcriptional regulator
MESAGKPDVESEAKPDAGTPAPAEPRWLDADERKTWLALISMMIKLPAALDAQLRDVKLSNFEYQVLAGLSESPERTLRMSVLAAFADGSLPRVSQVVGRLERRGLVRRHPDPDDGRYTLATLTDEGMDLLIKAAPGHVETVRRLVFDPTTKGQQHRLCDIARRVIRGIDPTDPCLDD